MKLLTVCMLIALLAKYLLIDINEPEPSLEFTARTALYDQLDDFHKTGDGSVDLYLAEESYLDGDLVISAVCGRYGGELFIFLDFNEKLYFRPKQATVDQRAKIERGLAEFWHAICKRGNPIAVKKLMDGVNNADKIWLATMEHVLKGDQDYLP